MEFSDGPKEVVFKLSTGFPKKKIVFWGTGAVSVILILAGIVSLRSDDSFVADISAAGETVLATITTGKSEKLLSVIDVKTGEKTIPVEKRAHGSPLAPQEQADQPISKSKEVKPLSKNCGIGKYSVLINEVAWAGRKDGPSDEWIELKNATDSLAYLSGMELYSEGGIAVVFSPADVIPPQGFYLLERTNDDSVSGISADLVFTGSLKNSGERITLIDECGSVIDEVSMTSWTAGDNEEYRTAERAEDLSWYSYSGSGSLGIMGTPKAPNSVPPLPAPPSPPEPPVVEPPVPPPSEATPPPSPPESESSATSPEPDILPPPPVEPSPSPVDSPSPSLNHVIISEVQINGGTGKANNDFIELYNPTSVAVDVSGWKLRKKTKTGTESSIRVIPENTSIQVHGYLLWANSDNDYHLSVAADFWSTATLTADSSIALMDSSGMIIDAVGWGSGHANPFVEEVPYPENPGANQSLARRSCEPEMKFCDTDSNRADFILNSVPTPRQ